MEDDVEGDSIYMAAELLNKKFSKSSDIFSLGVSFLEAVTGRKWKELNKNEEVQVEAYEVLMACQMPLMIK